MMRVARRIAVAALALVVVGALVVATRPSRFRVERSAQVAAPPHVVFSLIDDFHRWERWSPWEKIDPDMTRSFDGPPSGPGARYAWSGDANVGSGRMTITESRPGERVEIRLEFFEPMAATNQARFELTPAAGGTHVAWIMEGEHGFLGKAISLFMDMDAMVGGQFEKGLADLDGAARNEVARRGGEARLARPASTR
jgi:uncharacterized protein YndB with AHSA1/START domain